MPVERSNYLVRAAAEKRYPRVQPTVEDVYKRQPNLLTPKAHGKLPLLERFSYQYEALLQIEAILIDRRVDRLIDRIVTLHLREYLNLRPQVQIGVDFGPADHIVVAFVRTGTERDGVVEFEAFAIICAERQVHFGIVRGKRNVLKVV